MSQKDLAGAKRVGSFSLLSLAVQLPTAADSPLCSGCCPGPSGPLEKPGPLGTGQVGPEGRSWQRPPYRGVMWAMLTPGPHGRGLRKPAESRAGGRNQGAGGLSKPQRSRAYLHCAQHLACPWPSRAPGPRMSSLRFFTFPPKLDGLFPVEARTTDPAVTTLQNSNRNGSPWSRERGDRMRVL